MWGDLELIHVGLSSDSESGNKVSLRGEIRNKTSRHISTVHLRVIVRSNGIVVASKLFSVQGLPAGASKIFSQDLDGLEPRLLKLSTTKFDCSVESSF
ncbi:MAG: FxLYD domain-containing protein [Elusimicrobia bacterium]|nr:FxLYD domain-containing protein [Elusimicrobiota bacterium]